jgi:hypothetical protein
MSQFGTFLVQKGLATPEQVLEALNRQKARQRPIGAVAIERNLLTREQVFETLNQQVHRRKRFGELVVELGLGHLTDQDIEHLLAVQKEERPALGSILVEMGVLDFEAMTNALHQFLGAARA